MFKTMWCRTCFCLQPVPRNKAYKLLYHYHLHWLGNIGLEVLWSGPLPQRHAAGGIGSSRSSHQVNGDDSWLQMILGQDWWKMFKPVQVQLKSIVNSGKQPKRGRTIKEHCSLVTMCIDPDKLESRNWIFKARGTKWGIKSTERSSIFNPPSSFLMFPLQYGWGTQQPHLVNWKGGMIF